MPRGVDRLAYLAEYFDVVEVNSTFYRPATKAVVEGWISKTEDAPDFRFTIKLWKRFTHERDEAWTKGDEREVCVALDRLQQAGKLGAVLVQFPWSFKRTEEDRAWLADIVSAFSQYPLVVEIRHESWNVPEFYESLAEGGIGFVNIDQPLFKKSIKPSAKVTSAVGYIRVHGRNYKEWFRKEANVQERYDYLYTPEQLKPWVQRAESIAEQAKETYVITNNHSLGKAGVNALQMKSMLAHKKVSAPLTLVSTYSGELGGFVQAS
jgi:uncharacterized protein YecE (DUF72 family)